MTKLTKTIYNKLKPYEAHLERARAGYTYGMTTGEAMELISIYNSIFTVKELNTSVSCSRCRLRIATKLAEVYFQYKIENENPKTNKKTKSK